MKTIKRTFVDKANWDKGPWNEEPDKIQWIDPVTGLPCLAVRGNSGAWCGYVGVNRYHSLYGLPTSKLEMVDVHGGVTYAAACTDDENGVCHLVEDGEDDHVWWIGFDHAHLYDHSPSFEQYFRGHNLKHEHEHYTTLPEIQDEVTALAKQLKEMA